MQQGKVEALADSVGMSPAELAAYELLDEAQIKHLVQAMEEAQLRQSSALEAAIQKALSHVPKMLHRPILKILGRQGSLANE